MEHEPRSSASEFAGLTVVELAEKPIANDETGIARDAEDPVVTGTTISNNDVRLNPARSTLAQLGGDTVYEDALE